MYVYIFTCVFVVYLASSFCFEKITQPGMRESLHGVQAGWGDDLGQAVPMGCILAQAGLGFWVLGLGFAEGLRRGSWVAIRL